jgi:hypothetical protein
VNPTLFLECRLGPQSRTHLAYAGPSLEYVELELDDFERVDYFHPGYCDDPGVEFGVSDPDFWRFNEGVTPNPLCRASSHFELTYQPVGTWSGVIPAPDRCKPCVGEAAYLEDLIEWLTVRGSARILEAEWDAELEAEFAVVRARVDMRRAAESEARGWSRWVGIDLRRKLRRAREAS